MSAKKKACCQTEQILNWTLEVKQVRPGRLSGSNPVNSSQTGLMMCLSVRLVPGVSAQVAEIER